MDLEHGEAAGGMSQALRAASAVLLLAFVAVGAPKGESRAEDVVAKCTARNSERATVPQVAANPEKYDNRCVAIDGVMQWTFLYESVDGVYLQPPDTLNPASSGFQLGMNNVRQHSNGHFRHVSIRARVQDCESVREAVHASARENEYVMVTGYCHYFNGPYLQVQHLEFRRGPPFERRMGSYERKDYGDIEPAPDNWPHRAKVEQLAQQFLQSLRAKDRERLAGIHFRDAGLRWEDEEAAMLTFLLKNPESPFAAIRESSTTPQQLILVDRSNLYPKQEQEEPSREMLEDYTATICFCREQDCTGRWPIASFDADNVPSRPYACTKVGPYLDEGRSVPHFETLIREGGLAEPRQ